LSLSSNSTKKTSYVKKKEEGIKIKSRADRESEKQKEKDEAAKEKASGGKGEKGVAINTSANTTISTGTGTGTSTSTTTGPDVAMSKEDEAAIAKAMGGDDFSDFGDSDPLSLYDDDGEADVRDMFGVNSLD
jgi:hypothetical protein